jgi:hypothetical protein
MQQQEEEQQQQQQQQRVLGGFTRDIHGSDHI